MYTTPEARPITNAQYEHMKQIEQAMRWYKTGRPWLDINAFSAFVQWTSPRMPK